MNIEQRKKRQNEDEDLCWQPVAREYLQPLNGINEMFIQDLA